MGTIVSRRRKDGTSAYTAQIRLKKAGIIVHSEAETFNEKSRAKEWLRRRESELDQQRARGETLGQAPTLKEVIEWYRVDLKAHAEWGRTKEADLKRLGRYPLAKKVITRLTTQDFIAHVEARRAEGAGPATAGNDLIWLRQVLKSARASKGLAINLAALDDASHELRSRKAVAKSRQRARRLSADEESKLMAYFEERDKRSSVPMVDIIAFALGTARRQEEITSVRWADLDPDKGIATIRDVKDPRCKKGNHMQTRFLSPAWTIINRQPKTADTVFPYNAKTIGTAFTQACHVLGIEDLHFHDLRHEATSRLFEMGYSIQDVSQFTLHKSWATLKRYTHLSPANVPDRSMPPPRIKAMA